jgi:DNA polymerase II small subunit/DNA polymerase delta subunit B
VETIRGSVTKEEKIPVKVVPTKKVSTGFTVASTSSSVNVATESQSAKQGYSLFISIIIDYLVNSKHFCLKKTNQNRQ